MASDLSSSSQTEVPDEGLELEEEMQVDEVGANAVFSEEFTESTSFENADKHRDLRREEHFQGPHKWRQNLRHVSSPRLEEREPTVFDRSKRLSSESMHPHDSDSAHPNQARHSSTKTTREEEQVPNPPPWKREFMENNRHRKMQKQAPPQLGVQASQIPITLRRRGSLHGHTESAFTRQVVNSGLSVPAGRKKLSPSNSFRQSHSNSSVQTGRRSTSNQSLYVDVSTNTDVTKKRIERVQRARLYLLQLTGPNSFLIGGDSPDHKFKVIIGPQTCSCGRGPHCVHVLFVMLRVFKVGENDPCLWSRTLKNYEVESLFRIYHQRRKSRIAKRQPSQRQKEPSKMDNGDHDKSSDTPYGSRLPSESDAGSMREEEETCPICLLEMLEGESLIKCENGCQNRLHHHCISVWFEECRRQKDPLNCPLCRAQWKTTTVEIKSTQNPNEGPNVPPNTRASSPQTTSAEEERLPYAEAIPEELRETAAPWIETLGSELVSCLLSRNWSLREAGLKHLTKEIMSALLKGSEEGGGNSGINGGSSSSSSRSGAVVRTAAAHAMLQTACDVLAYMCADPVYRVFVASLRSLRTLLAYTPCRDSEQQARLQAILKPIVEAIILKCTDGNRRTNQLSLSTLVELVKGQEGELAVGREIIDSGTSGLDGLNYVLKCITEDYNIESVPWQWLLGRLYVIDRLLEEFPTDFVPGSEGNAHAAGAADCGDNGMDGGAAAAAGGACEETSQHEDDGSGAATNYRRLMSVAHFSVKAVCSSHMRIARMSRRVFLLSAKLGAHVQNVIAELKDLLAQIDSSSVASLGRKLDRIVEDFQLSERIVYQLMHGNGRRGKYDLTGNTPVDSPASTPRSNSPVPFAGQENNSEVEIVSTSERSAPVPCAPPNTPTQRGKRRLKRVIPRRSYREVSQPCAPPPTSVNSPEKNPEHQKESLVVDPLPDSKYSGSSRLSQNLRLGSSSPPARKRSGIPLRRRTIEGDRAPKRDKSSSPTIRRRTVDGSHTSFSKEAPPQYLPRSHRNTPPTQSLCPIPMISVTDTSDTLQINTNDEAEGGTGAFMPVILSDVDESSYGKDSKEKDEDSSEDVLSCNNQRKNNQMMVSVEEEVEEAQSSGTIHYDQDNQMGANGIPPVTPPPPPTAHNSPHRHPSSESPSVPYSHHQFTATCCKCRCHIPAATSTTDLDMMSPKSGTAALPNTPESAGKAHYHTVSEQESISSDDFLDFSQETTQHKDEKPISFKSEVADSPKSSPSHSIHSGASSKSEDCGTCKEEVEREEAEALAKAMDVSEHQDPCPVVPGLTPTAREEVITIRIQPDQENEDTYDIPDSNSAPSIYLEKIHWVKGPLLGTGAFSSCYQARDARTGVVMAVKQISFCRNSPQDQEKVVEAISEEIHMMSRLNHPNVVRILGATKQGCHFNMFVEWMAGGTLSYLLGEYGTFTDQVLVSYTRQLLKGLAYLHDQHILHRDLKGSNLLVNSTGQNLRIGDFGASARLASQATGAGEFQGQLLGTIAFMAPEVLRGESYGRACDVWSVGCVMIEMATTKPPWNAADVSNHLALIFKIASSMDSPPIPEKLTPPIKDLMLRCLEQKSEDRPTAKELLLHPLFTQWFTSSMNGNPGNPKSSKVS